MNFTLLFTNVDCSLDGSVYPTVAEAIAAGRRAGFEFSVWDEYLYSNRVASYSVFGGLWIAKMV